MAFLVVSLESIKAGGLLDDKLAGEGGGSSMLAFKPYLNKIVCLLFISFFISLFKLKEDVELFSECSLSDSESVSYSEIISSSLFSASLSDSNESFSLKLSIYTTSP